jgi:hypothetical protein
MRTLIRRTALFTTAATGMAGLISYYALLTHLAFAAQARRLLAVHFTTIPARPSVVAGIWLHNSHLVIGVAVCLLVTGLAGGAKRGRRGFRFADLLLTVWAVGVALTAGVLLGAYGSEQARAFWPYAPVEVAAWAMLLAVYASARLGRHGWRRTVRGLLTVEVLLAVAAFLEVSGGKWL